MTRLFSQLGLLLWTGSVLVACGSGAPASGGSPPAPRPPQHQQSAPADAGHSDTVAATAPEAGPLVKGVTIAAAGDLVLNPLTRNAVRAAGPDGYEQTLAGFAAHVVDEELTFIMPGGSMEAWKSSKYRYRLIWKGRQGFIRLALRNRCPIIPSANVGTDDTYRVFLNGYQTAYKFFRTRKALFPISVPIGIGVLPIPTKMVQYIGEPIHLPYPPEAAQDPAVVEECQKLVKGRVYELIDQGLQERSARE